MLHAYNATNLALELYNSSQNSTRDHPGGAVKMTAPVVTSGKVYVGAEFALSVYGPSIFLNAPTISPAGGAFTNSVTAVFSAAKTASSTRARSASASALDARRLAMSPPKWIKL